MKLKQKPTNQLILLLAFVVTFSLLGAYYIYQPEPSFFSSSSHPVVSSVSKNDDTVLMIQATANSGCTNTLQLSETSLLGLPQQQFKTHHSWSAEAETFTGPLLEDIIKIACGDATKINLKALNDYSVDVDFTIAKSFRPIVAHSINGSRLSVRDKGPLWIMVPSDDLKVVSKEVDGMLIWQLSDITILNTI
ncbi:hypothetical protein [Leucothrix arctica]|uniref:Oxidoreductase molybdopterin-binding domain-containing protein n=1 Tax=Leucothrix arctica TaxID=1481894 RepID=A0A317CDR5_9GAMM|nr:hypothetical protein [Leucothrix arctica]PWQ96519.1 hypothetical protein DKT75_09025 [Leucothrix arctica]